MKPRILTVSHIARDIRGYAPDPFPFIRLSGLWLKSAGFEVGDRITVAIIQPGRLEITNTRATNAVDNGKDG